MAVVVQRGKTITKQKSKKQQQQKTSTRSHACVRLEGQCADLAKATTGKVKALSDSEHTFTSVSSSMSPIEMCMINGCCPEGAAGHQGSKATTRATDHKPKQSVRALTRTEREREGERESVRVIANQNNKATQRRREGGEKSAFGFFFLFCFCVVPEYQKTTPQNVVPSVGCYKC